jgi:predicted amidohydrolase
MSRADPDAVVTEMIRRAAGEPVIPERYTHHAPQVTVACANFPVRWGDKEANLGTIETMVREGARQGADLVLFPELALSGYECDDAPCAMHHALAEPIPGPATERLAGLTRELDLYLVFGMPERDGRDPSRHYIAAPLIGPQGWIGTYRKLHVAGRPLFTETDCFVGGDAVPVFDTRFGPIGIQICADFWVYPELSRILMQKGARLILNATASADAPDRPYYMTTMVGARAMENMCYTASSNLVGRERNKSYYGHSTIAGPAFPRFVKVFAQGARDPELVVATLGFAQLHRFREAVGIARMRRSDVIDREFAALADLAATAPVAKAV